MRSRKCNHSGVKNTAFLFQIIESIPQYRYFGTFFSKSTEGISTKRYRGTVPRIKVPRYYPPLLTTYSTTIHK